MLDLRRILQIFSQAKGAGVIEIATEDERLDGRMVTIRGRRVVNFSSCSYLGLEFDPRLRAAVVDAVERYGTQFSSSRAYLSAPQYSEVEALLERICKRPVLVAPSTSLAHQAALPVLIGDGDAVLLDQHVHNSVRAACSSLVGRGAQLVDLPHNRLSVLEQKLATLQNEHRRIWVLMDGLYSMYGTHASFDGLDGLLERHPTLHVYCDDAHATSWVGRDGEGMALARWARHPRVYVALSLNKSFAAAGGVVTFPSRRKLQRVRHLGEPMIFSGPIQPPMLGAIAASARIHLSDELGELQAALTKRIGHFNEAAQGAGLELVNSCESPIRFIELGAPRSAIDVTQQLVERGFFVNCAAYPAVPEPRSGLRITLTNHLELADIDDLVSNIASLVARRSRAKSISSWSKRPAASAWSLRGEARPTTRLPKPAQPRAFGSSSARNPVGVHD